MQSKAVNGDKNVPGNAEHILHALPIGCFELNAEGILTYINQKARQLLNLTDDVLGCNIVRVLKEPQHAEILKFIQSALTNAAEAKYSCYFNTTNFRVDLIASPSSPGKIITMTECLPPQLDIALNENNQLLRSLFDTALIGMAIHEAVRDDTGKITDFRIKLVNKELEKLTGRTDLVGKLYAEVFPGIKVTGLFDLMLRVMKTGEPGQMDYSYYQDGFQKWFSSMFVKLNDGLVATNLDITDRKQNEEEKFKAFTVLQQSEEIAEMGSWEYDRDTKKFIWSDGMYHLFALEKDLSVEPEIYRICAKEKSKPAADRVIQYLRTGVKPFEETVEVMVKGVAKTIKVRATVIGKEQPETAKVLGVDMDISAIKQAEEKIKEDAAMIKGIVDAVPDMLYLIDIRNKQLIYGNNQVLNMFQKTIEEMRAIGPMLFEAVVYAPDRPVFEENISTLQRAEDGEVKELVYRLMDSAGNIHWVKARQTVYKRDEFGLATHVIGISQDVTMEVKLKEKNRQLTQERKRLQERQQQEIFRATLSTQEEERKRIAESLHNGLGQILYGVKLSLGQVNLRFPERLDENREALQQTGQLLSDAIKESRRISHELTPGILQDFGLQAAISDICSQFSKALTFKCDFSAFRNRLDSIIEIAVYRIAQELMLNAVKHAQATEGLIKVEVSKDSIGIKVWDNGKGFNIESGKNTGIGLKTIQSKVKMMNGSFSINTAPGEGTSVIITLPLKLG